MKRLFLPLAVILLISAAALFNSYSLTHLTGELSTLLCRAQAAAESGNFSEALQLTEKAEREFLKYGTYFHSTLNHQTIDGIRFSFSEVLEQLKSCERNSLYNIANSDLLLKLQLLADAEQFSFKNLL